MSERGAHTEPVEAILFRPWDIGARGYLARLGDAEYAEFLQRRGPRRKREHYSPSDYHRDLIALLNAGREEEFKYLKMMRHDFSALARKEVAEEKKRMEGEGGEMSGEKGGGPAPAEGGGG